ncbi:MAG: Nramp family divalent metal transporter [Thermoprotei archaeon]
MNLREEVGSSRAIVFLRMFYRFLGPALMVSVAYMDPGNYGTDLQAGSAYGYRLVWAVWLASLMAMILQYLSGKLGLASGSSLPELAARSINRKSGIVGYWLASEVAIAATDLAEYLGTVLALNLLFGIPLIVASFVGAVDVLLILSLSSRRFRTIEELFMILVGVISLGFLYLAFATSPNLTEAARFSVTPNLPGNGALLVVVGIIGATVMPHSLFVHSYLTKNKLGSLEPMDKKRVLKLHLLENVLLLSLAATVNVAILVVSAASMYPNPNPTIQQSFHVFAQRFGGAVAIIFALTLLASGLSSSTTGTIAGQAVMEGTLGVKVNPWVRRLVTRFINVFVTTIVLVLGLNPLGVLVYSQVVLSVLLPLPLYPLIYYTAKRGLMGEFVNRSYTTIIAVLCAVVITALNVYLLLNA